jgi:glutathionylspermidine synthase
MDRITLPLRENWQERLAERAFTQVEASSPTPYWREGACYRFSEDEIDKLEGAANELQALCLQAVDHVVRYDLYEHFGIPEDFRDYVASSWKRMDPSVYGRFDLAFDGVNPPKMLEYNADTPATLYETAVLQWDWLEDTGRPIQFNTVHERLIETWQTVNADYKFLKPVYFASCTDTPEDFLTTEYLRDTCEQAGIPTRGIDINQIGWNGRDFTDLDENRIGTLFKFYPWEWLTGEEFGRNILADRTGFIEPAWKMILSNKAVLPMLWELNPGHPNLLPAFRTAQAFKDQPYVQKALYGREGANVRIVHPDCPEDSPGPYGREGYIYQAYTKLPSFGGHHPVLGVWIVGGQACGMGIREDASRITKSTSCYVPHYFDPQ